jgi:cell division protein FtsI (penicillin-binding protein 3)
VVVNEPAGEKHYGGEVAGPVFKRIASKALAYLGVRPDRQRALAEKQKPPRSVSMARDGYLDTDPAPPLPDARAAVGATILIPDFTGMSIIEVISEAQRVGLKVKLMGSGRAVAQSPGPGPTRMKTTCRVSFRPPG